MTTPRKPPARPRIQKASTAHPVDVMAERMAGEQAAMPDAKQGGEQADSPVVSPASEQASEAVVSPASKPASEDTSTQPIALASVPTLAPPVVAARSEFTSLLNTRVTPRMARAIEVHMASTKERKVDLVNRALSFVLADALAQVDQAEAGGSNLS